MTPPTLAWEGWLVAVPLVLPSLLASLLFAARLLGLVWLSGSGLAWAGGAVGGGCLLSA